LGGEFKLYFYFLVFTILEQVKQALSIQQGFLFTIRRTCTGTLGWVVSSLLPELTFTVHPQTQDADPTGL